MKNKMTKLITTVGLLGLLVAPVIACSVQDCCNYTSCATSGSQCTVSVMGSNVYGTCGGANNQWQIDSADSGFGVTSGITCTCSYSYQTEEGDHGTVNSQVSPKATYDKLNSVSCPK